jgi:hypothetical protein
VLYAAIDIHKHAFQAAVFDPESGEVTEARFSADCESLARWAEEWRDRVSAVAIEATTGWRWVWRELVSLASTCGWPSRCRRAVRSAVAGARRPIGSMRAGWRGCWRGSRSGHPELRLRGVGSHRVAEQQSADAAAGMRERARLPRSGLVRPQHRQRGQLGDGAPDLRAVGGADADDR